jgi:hypothetical protein
MRKAGGIAAHSVGYAHSQSFNAANRFRSIKTQHNQQRPGSVFSVTVRPPTGTHALVQLHVTRHAAHRRTTFGYSVHLQAQHLLGAAAHTKYMLRHNHRAIETWPTAGTTGLLQRTMHSNRLGGT